MKWVASVCGVGFLRPAPGTWGSLAAVPLAYGAHGIGGFWFLLNVTFFVFIYGYAATRAVTANSDDHDPSWIVIDEVAGQLVALFPVSYGAGMMGVEIWRLWPGWIAAFLLFRLFDITKPWIIGRVDRMGGPLSVMLDDVIAGVFAAIGVIALGGLYHTVLM